MTQLDPEDARSVPKSTGRNGRYETILPCWSGACSGRPFFGPASDCSIQNQTESLPKIESCPNLFFQNVSRVVRRTIPFKVRGGFQSNTGIFHVQGNSGSNLCCMEGDDERIAGYLGNCDGVPFPGENEEAAELPDGYGCSRMGSASGSRTHTSRFRK